MQDLHGGNPTNIMHLSESGVFDSQVFKYCNLLAEHHFPAYAGGTGDVELTPAILVNPP